MRAGFTGQGPAVLTQYTADGEQAIDLPAASSPYAAMIGHGPTCRFSGLRITMQDWPRRSPCLLNDP
jgi:hypothetical protein